MDNRQMWMEQILRLLELATEEQLREGGGRIPNAWDSGKRGAAGPPLFFLKKYV